MTEQWPKPPKYPLRKRVGRLLAPLLRGLARGLDITELSQIAEQGKFFRATPAKIKQLLQGQRLQLLDVGARGGVEPGWEKYLTLADTTLVEPDPTEAALLEQAGFQVVPKLIGGEVGEGTLNLCNKGGSSSTLQPGGPFHAFYAANAMERFQVKERITLPMTTIAAVVEERGVPFDYVKLDTQGSEAAIIRSMGDLLPLMIKSEISFVPLYQDSSRLFEVAEMLWSRGYAMFHLTYTSKGSPEQQRSTHPFRHSTLPLHGDAWFFPDWTRPEGQAMIRGRLQQYQALMSIFALEEIAQYALQNMQAD